MRFTLSVGRPTHGASVDHPTLAASVVQPTLAASAGPEVPQLHRRQASLACEAAHGEGFEKCGGAESKFCYNPARGQTCCLAESGFCDVGYFCAPNEGFCCLEGENGEDCAKRAGFQALTDGTPDTDAVVTTIVRTTTMVTIMTFYPASPIVSSGNFEAHTLPPPPPLVSPTDTLHQTGGVTNTTGAVGNSSHLGVDAGASLIVVALLYAVGGCAL